MAELKEDYQSILDDEDYAEIADAAADIPIADKNAATHKSEDYGRGELSVRSASLAMIIIFAAELVFSVLDGSIPFSVLTALCLAASIIFSVYMARGKLFARYASVAVCAVGIIICAVKMTDIAGSGSGTAYALVIWLIEGAAEIFLMMSLISDKSINAFFTYNNRLDRIREASRRKKFLDSIGKRFK